MCQEAAAEEDPEDELPDEDKRIVEAVDGIPGRELAHDGHRNVVHEVVAHRGRLLDDGNAELVELVFGSDATWIITY